MTGTVEKNQGHSPLGLAQGIYSFHNWRRWREKPILSQKKKKENVSLEGTLKFHKNPGSEVLCWRQLEEYKLTKPTFVNRSYIMLRVWARASAANQTEQFNMSLEAVLQFLGKAPEKRWQETRHALAGTASNYLCRVTWFILWASTSHLWEKGCGPWVLIQDI